MLTSPKVEAERSETSPVLNLEVKSSMSSMFGSSGQELSTAKIDCERIEAILHIEEATKQDGQNHNADGIQKELKGEENASANEIFNCDKCDFTTIYKNGLLSHIGNIHSPTAKPFKCKECEYTSAKNRNLWKHLRRVHGQVAKPKKPKCGSCNKAPCKCKVIFSCSQCSYTAKQKLHIDGHVARVHEGIKKFMCEECGTSFWRNSNLRKHLRDTHGDKSFSCDRCSYKTAHKRSLNHHIQYVHEGIKPYKCVYQECNFSGTSTKSKLDEHLSLVHQHVYSCDNCDHKTQDRTDLIKHNKFTHLKCDNCELSFDKKSHLTNHMIDIHPDVKPYKCHLCTYATADQLLLKRHQKHTHADTTLPLSCQQCTFTTARQDSLTKHIKYIHEGKEKPYKCSYPNCSTGTYTQAKLDTHIRRKHVEGRHHYKDEKTIEWKRRLEEANVFELVDAESTVLEINEADTISLLHEENVELDSLDTGYSDNLEPTNFAEKEVSGVTKQLIIEACDYGPFDRNLEGDNENIDPHAKEKICEETSNQSNIQNITNGIVVGAVHTDKPFKCKLCDYSGAKKRYLKKHMTTTHQEYTTALTTANESSQLKVVVPKQDEANRAGISLKCDRCDYLTDEKYLLARHVKNVHSVIKSFACSKCDFKTTYKYGLDKHVKVVHENFKPHQCTYPNCSFKGTANKANLDIHIRAVHLKVKDHVCDLCGYATVDKHTLLAHKKGVHDGIKDLICSTCGYVTSYPKALQRHMKVVHETKKLEPHELVKDYICVTCGFATHNQKNLKDHAKRRHESLDDKICGTCGFTTNTQANLNAHMRRKHEDQFVEPVKTISCDRCSYVTNRISCLRQHKKASHDRIKDKVCAECGFETSYAGSLKNHINEVHTNEKLSAKCTLCSYSTNRTRNLKTHVMTVHYKIKPKSRIKQNENSSDLEMTTHPAKELHITSNINTSVHFQTSMT